MINILKTTGKNKNCNQVAAKWIQFSPCYSYVASYNELEQIHMQVLLNCHLAAFLYSILKKWPNDNLITLACVIALVHYS